MTRYALSVIALAALGAAPVLGQAPAIVPKGADVALAAGGRAPLRPDGAACISTKTACVWQPYVKEIKHVTYTYGCEPRCVSFAYGLFRCHDCAQGQCGHPIPTRYLVKKVHYTQEECIKCGAAEVPVCDKGHCGAPCFGAAVQAPRVLIAPALPTAAHAP